MGVKEKLHIFISAIKTDRISCFMRTGHIRVERCWKKKQNSRINFHYYMKFSYANLLCLIKNHAMNFLRIFVIITNYHKNQNNHPTKNPTNNTNKHDVFISIRFLLHIIQQNLFSQSNILPWQFLLHSTQLFIWWANFFHYIWRPYGGTCRFRYLMYNNYRKKKLVLCI